MHDLDLRPLSVGEILDRSFGLFRRLAIPLIVVQLICVGLVVPLQSYFVAGGQQISVGYFAVFLLGFLLSSLASAATALIISRTYLGARLAPVPAIGLALPKVVPLLLLSLSLGLILFVSLLPTLLLVTAGGAMLQQAAAGGASLTVGVIAMLVGVLLMALPFFVLAGLLVTTPALVIEDLGAGRALTRSWQLTRGNRVRVIAVLFVTVVVLLIPYMGVAVLGVVLTGGANSGGAAALFTALSSLTSLVLTPLFYCVLTLMYYDLRVRREGFDLERLATSLELSRP